uniref:Xylulose kinase-1 n=1 Tax=Tanacetum cinerariifolium TaxID=118510 RepID=A0A6L2P753_TANCI|nr:hypothetical protein [Tanacetum cinerariifolium]
MVAYLSKSDASEGFHQILDFLNGSSIKYALTVNPNIYLSYIKQFWTTVVVKQVNDVTRLQALIDKKNVVVTESTIRGALRLDDEEGVDYLSNEEIFADLVRNVDSPTKFYMYPCFLQLMIRKQVGDLSTYTTKYTSLALTQKVFTNMRRVGKGFSGVETPLFEEMLVLLMEKFLLLLQNHIYHLLHHLLHHHNHLKISLQLPKYNKHHHNHLRVEHLEFDKVAQALEITKLKRRVKKLERRNKGRMIAEMDQDDVVVLEDDKEEDMEVVDDVKDVEEAKEDETKPAKVQEVVDVVTTAKLITKVVTTASETITAASAIITTAEAQVSAATTTATLTDTPARVATAPSRRRKGVDIDWEEAIDHVKRKAKEDHVVKRYQVLKRKPQTKAQARKNMMMYLKNVDGFKIDYFKGMSYDDIHPIFEAKFNSNVAFLLKKKEQIKEDENRALQKINKTPVERAAKRRKLDEEVPVVDYQIIEMNNKPYYKIIRADDTHQLYISFLTLMRNFDREDLKALWSLVKERFYTTKPKNFSNDFLLVTLGEMFKKPDIHAQIWKNQRTVDGLEKVILLVERKYPLTRFTLDQMLNAVRLKVEEKSEVSLKLLRFTRQQH